MGISKFFRWMSERYPFVLQLVEENRIPQFDNLYLDMNGIIHHCSHPNEGNAHFRITEEEIFLGIFSYLENLFSLAKPQKVFFLAVDGVAPRAKMNQQRSRRFKTAKENQELIRRAINKGEKLPTTSGFDSNCITPGTPFMTRLSEQLKYFINKKVSEDSAWQAVQVIFSGHDVPGEGEHKIMEYIRLSKAQEDYNPNIRHCVYGLDADLIMLALLSHDPHFCLLREEVKFSSRKNQGRGLQSQQFYLLHISLVRDYLDWEFASLRTINNLEYDLERIIDDFILLCIFVGNDFLPHLPNLHINEGALGLLFDIYKKVLPQAGGYLNEAGTLNTRRLQLILDELVSHERENFEHICADSSWIESKHPSCTNPKSSTSDGPSILSETQRTLLEQIEHFFKSNLHSPNKYEATLAMAACYPAKDRKFLKNLAAELNLCISFDEFDENDEPLIILAFDQDQSSSVDPDIDAISNMLEDVKIDQSSKSAGSLESQSEQVFRKYHKAAQEPKWDEERFEEEQERKFQAALNDWKSRYYSEKMNLDFHSPDQLGKLTYAYTEGLQWVLHYYYDGVASWSWFYPYHYSPMISDLNNVSSYEFSFTLGQPFKPFEQLMGVLPELSSAHIPFAFRDLMTNSESPIIDLYPSEFETDLNGKKHDWEAIVKIPFIDQERLLKAMKAHEHKLLEEERRRNEFGPTWQFCYDPKESVTYPSSLPGFFPDLHNCHSRMTTYDLPTIEGLHLIKGLCEGVLLGKDAVAGFPSLHNLPHTGILEFHRIKVHQSESRNETIVIHVHNIYEGSKVEDLVNLLVGSQVFVGYPFLREAKVTGLSDSLFRYELDAHSNRCRSTPHGCFALSAWKRNADNIQYELSKKFGLVVGNIDILVHAKQIKGLKRRDDGALIKDYEERESDYALQVIVLNVSSCDSRFKEQLARPIEEELPIDSKVFFLGPSHYGAPGQVIGHSKHKLDLRIMSFPSDKEESFAFRSVARGDGSKPYVPSHSLFTRLGMSALTLSKITSSVMVLENNHNDNKVNIGLSMKFEGKSQKVLGLTRKTENGWEFSQQAIDLINDYRRLFPEIFEALDTRQDIVNAVQVFPYNTEAKLAEVKSWMKAKGIRDFERVSLETDLLDSATISQLESIASKYSSLRSPDNAKQAIIRNVPGRAVLKPSHAEEKLGGQTFELGDRVSMVSDRGTVPISAKGVVVGIGSKLIDVVFDIPFIGGTNLSNRCEMYRGASIPPSTILNLTSLQFCQSIAGPMPPKQGPVKNSHPAVQANVSNQNRWQRGGPLISNGYHHNHSTLNNARGTYSTGACPGWSTNHHPANPSPADYESPTWKGNNESPAWQRNNVAPSTWQRNIAEPPTRQRINEPITWRRGNPEPRRPDNGSRGQNNDMTPQVLFRGRGRGNFASPVTRAHDTAHTWRTDHDSSQEGGRGRGGVRGGRPRARAR